jgi:hypothetical protein
VAATGFPKIAVECEDGMKNRGNDTSCTLLAMLDAHQDKLQT